MRMVLTAGNLTGRYRRSYGIIYRYISKEFIFSFFVSFLFFFFIFFVNQLLLLAEDILSKHVPFKSVILLVVYSFPLIISLSVPFASLVGALMTVGRFSSDNEILAFLASGIPQKRIFIPLFVMGVLLSCLSFTVNDYFLPRGTVNFLKLYRDLIYSNPEIELEPYSIKRYQDSIIITGNVDERIISNVVIFDKTEEKNKRIITAATAKLVDAGDQQGVISLQLEQVYSQTVDAQKRDRFEYSEAETMIYNILLKDITFSIRNPGPGEMRSIDVYNVIQEKSKRLEEKQNEYMRSLASRYQALAFEYIASLELLESGRESLETVTNRLDILLNNYENALAKKINDRSLQLYKLEFYKKFSVPFACLVFIFFAFPVGLFTRRSGRSVGFGIGLLISVIYWGMLLVGQTLGLRVGYPPFLSMWIPNFVMLVLGSLFFLIRLRK